MNFIGNISSVDNAIGVNGGRPYSMRITRICDWANNCVNGTFASPLHTLTYNIYANTNLASATSSTATITDGTAEADGSPHAFIMSVVDTYGNKIRPATGITRTINM